MKKKILILFRLFVVGTLVAFFFAFMLHWRNHSIIPAVVLELLVCLISFPFPIFVVTNRLLQKTPWFQNNYGDCIKFKTQHFNTDVVNVGSSLAKYALDYSNFKILGANWATSPQSFLYDYKIIKNYHSYLKENATILLIACPFSGLYKDEISPIRDKKYHFFLHTILVPNFSEDIFSLMQQEVKKPFITLFKHPLKTLKSFVHNRKNVLSINKNSMSQPELETDAKRWIGGWQKEFKLNSLSDSLSEVHLKNIDYNVQILCDIVDFCQERSFKPVLLVVPTTQHLAKYFPNEFKEVAVDGLLKKVQNLKKIPILNYRDDDAFKDDNLYMNSFFLNKKGRHLFTQRVLKDLNLI